ncbi:MAG: hypothetical protein ACI3VE_04975, partial [Oscillospiraceae bacterium]
RPAKKQDNNFFPVVAALQIIVFAGGCRSDERCSPLRVRDLRLPCHLEIGNVPNIAAGYIRADAKKKRTIFNADRPCAEHVCQDWQYRTAHGSAVLHFYLNISG